MNVPRTLLAVGLALTAVLAGAPPAAAHGGAVESTDYRADITAVRPRVAGLEVRLVEAGGRIEVTNRTDREVVVLGYEDEPYLRVGAAGVFRNRNSPATYLNARRSGGDEVPAEATPDAEPDWERIGDGPTARWHDHRLHWMASAPPGVREDPGRRQQLAEWALPLRLGDRAVEVRGTITYVPGPPVWPWLVVAAGLAAATVLAARHLSLRRTLLVVVPVLVAADIGRVLALTYALVGDAGERVGQFFDVGLLGLVGWALGIVAVVRLSTGDDDGVVAAGLGAVVLALSGGVLELGDLGRSQLGVAGPDDLARLCVAVALGLGSGTAAAVTFGVVQAPRAATRASTS